MNLDISAILKDWPYESGQVSVRRIVGADGRERIQLRLDLGLLQMETMGRPDGQRPHGFDSLLDYYEDQLRLWQEQHGDDKGFELDEQACELLRSEGTMYYHRYLAEYVLEEYGGVERDTRRNLRMFDMCNRYSRETSDRFVLEQYRPYVIMMCTRARAMQSLRDNRPKAALASVKAGIVQIRQFVRQYGQASKLAASGELSVLRAIKREIEGRIPIDPIQQIRKDLARAVSEERYEEAAGLRDRLRRLGDIDKSRD